MKRILLIHLGLFFVLCLFAQQIVAPHYENFDTMVAGANQVPQNGWRSIARNTTFSTAVVNISNTTPYSTPNVARLYTNNNPDAEIYLISPEAVGLGSSKITFQARVAGTNAAALPNLIVGFMTEVNNPLTFEPVQVISTLNLSYQQFEVSFQGYDFDVEDRYYIAFKHGVSSATRAILIDNFAYEVLPVEPVFSCSPASKNFGSIDVGYQSTLQVFSISNTGVGALEISSVALTGADADQFTILSEPESYPVLISNIQSIEVTVRFNPDSIGQKNALLSISQGGTGATVHHIPLSGTGIIRPQGSTHLNPIIINTQSYSLQGTLNDYGNDYGSNWVSPSQIVLAGFDVVLQFTLEEDSFLSCDVQTSVGHGGVIIVNQIPSLASPAPVFIVASGDMGNSFTNRPLQAGTYYAIVSTYISNSMPVTFNFSFSFVPAGPAILSLTPQAYNYSYVPIGFSKQQNFQITNSGGGIIELETLQFLTSHPGSYTLVPPAESFPLQLAVGQTVGFSVTFAPTYEGMMEAEVRLPYCIVGNGGVRIPREEATIALMGFGHQLFAGGSGTQNDPYLISQPYHLNSIRYFLGENHRGKYYLQTTDLDFNIFPYNQGEGWEPIGDFFTDASYNAFTGIYNGNGYLIRNLYINRPATNHVGLFGVIEAATFKNVHLRNVNVTGQIRVGAMIGYCQYNLSITAIITQCSVETGTVSGIGFIGGLIGWTASTHLGRSHSNLNVSIIPNHIIYSDDVKLGYGGLVGANVTR
ncbi:MAG: choice-of-anchor D domain-containing protein, partial [Candidatus Cloacimonetes bacterium]|nr:choice-of-anchor D domain-containing protein [Candidatus Cloacimonadota bacterium]